MPGIDQQVQQTVDQFRGNPQGLQKRYQQNQQLLDLLALQRLKSEKDAAARNMQMQMQTSPQTIKDQREQELLQRTKQEMAQQVGGVMQQQAQQQQKRAQAAGLGRLAQAPQAGMPAPRPQGAPQGGAPMPKMAAGGIVALFEGGSVSAEELLQRLRFTDNLGSDSTIDRGILRAAKGRLSEEDITPDMRLEFALQQAGPQARRAIEDYKTKAPQQKAEDAARKAQSAAREEAGVQEFMSSIGAKPIEKPGVATPSASATNSDAPGPTAAGGQGLAALNATTGTAGTTAGDDADADAGAGAGTGTTLPNSDALLAQIMDTKLAAPAVPVQDVAKPNATDRTNLDTQAMGLLSKFGMAPAQLKDPDAAKIADRDEAAKFQRRDETRAEYERMLAKQEAMDAEFSDPDALRQQQLISFLTGAAGRGSTALAGGAAASMRTADSQRAARYKRMEDSQAIAREKLTADYNISSRAIEAGLSAAERAGEARNTAMNLARDLSAEELRARTADTQNLLQVDIANTEAANAAARTAAELDLNIQVTNLESLVDVYQARATNELAKAQRDMTSAPAILQAASNIAETISAVEEAIITSDVELTNLRNRAERSPEDRQKYEDRMEELREQAAITIGNAGLYKTQAAINKLVAQVTGSADVASAYTGVPLPTSSQGGSNLSNLSPNTLNLLQQYPTPQQP